VLQKLGDLTDETHSQLSLGPPSTRYEDEKVNYGSKVMAEHLKSVIDYDLTRYENMKRKRHPDKVLFEDMGRHY
jgi:hypothetical protein